MFINRKKSVLRNISMLLLVGIVSQISAPVVYAAELKVRGYAYSESRGVSGNEFLKTLYGALEKLYSGMKDPLSEQVQTEVVSMNSLPSDEGTASAVIPEQAESMKLQKTLGGPGQSESSGFSLGSTDGMVDKFSGDFNQSIPLMDVEGFPLVLSYTSNVIMNSEASWVGLGWDLNLGAVSRDMRGIPDEFNGTDMIRKKENQLSEDLKGNKNGGYLAMSYSFGTSDNKGVMFTPSLQLTYLSGKYTSNLLGLGHTRDFGLEIRFDLSTDQELIKGSPTEKGGVFGLNFGLGYTKDSKRGSGLNTSYGAGFGFAKSGNNVGANMSFGINSNSREGLTDWTTGFNLGGKLNSHSASISHVASAPYGTQTVIPGISMGNTSSSFQFNFDAFVAVSAGITVQAGYLGQKYNNKSSVDYNGTEYQQPALGYLHNGKRYSFPSGSMVLMDYQRTNDQEYSEEMKHLPGSFQTFDLFYYSSPTQQGSFRANRTDFGTYFDPAVISQHNSLSDAELSEFYEKIPDILADILGTVLSPDVVNLSIGVLWKNGLKIQIGLGLGKQEVETEYNTDWDHGTNAALLKFTAQNQGNSFDNTTYFKTLGESTPTEMGAWSYMGGNSLSSFNVAEAGKSINVGADLNGTPVVSNTLNSLNKKPIRATAINPITASSSVTSIQNYPSTVNIAHNSLPRISGYKKANHISEVEIIDESGVKNVYGVPAYNKSYSEVSFSSGGLSTSGNVVSYNSSGAFADNSTGNTRGRSNYYNKTTMPAFAHSFLLTQVLGPDYVDRTSDGPSLDDVGSYHKINYRQITDSYKWRIPVSGSVSAGSTPIAYHNPGFLGTNLDDVGNYSFGEKELWYAHSVEGKNLIAVFILSDRKDGHQADENGLINPSNASLKKLQKLDKIILYNRNDFLNNGNNATALQTVLFEYNYSLCLNNPSNQETYGGNSAESGKLTLKKIRIMGGKSQEGALSSYDFDYSEYNPSFSYQNVDGWGCYQLNNAALPNDLYPYTHNKYSDPEVESVERGSSWKLKKVHLPTGGSLTISYDSDHYSYVQEKRAMRHFTMEGMMTEQELYPLLGSGSWNGASGLSDEFRKLIGNMVQYRNVIVFKLDRPLASGLAQTDADDLIRDQYFKDPYNGTQLTELFIKAKVLIKPGVEELIPMFVPLDNQNNVFGAMPAGVDGTRQYGYAVLELYDVSEMESNDKRAKKWSDHGTLIHPIQRIALDYARQNLPDKIYGACATCDSDIDANIDKRVLFGTLIYKYMIEDANYAGKLYPSKSLVKLYEADDRKLGGNACVTNITYSDNWNAISEEYESIYSWDYAYGGSRRQGKSNGVATFEPMKIMDENVHYYWDTYVNERKKFVDENKFHPRPIFSTLYPTASVGYSEVVVTFSGQTSKGKSVAKFHTYKEHEYSTFEDATELGEGHHAKYTNKKSITKFLGAKGLDFFGFTEGFLVLTNDFHGKPIESSTYDGDGYLQASTKYTYYGKYETIPMLDRKGDLANYRTSVEYDIHTEQRAVENFSSFHIGGLGVGITIIPPSVSFSPYYTWNNSDRAFYSYSLVKHLNYYARVKSVETTYMNSHNVAENQIYDKYSGAVIASSFEDEFNDRLYQFSYPSHWYHSGLREISNATTITSYTGSLSANTFTTIGINDLEELFAPGDAVVLANVATPLITMDAVIMSTSKTVVKLITPSGTAFSATSGTYTIRLARTNRTNRLSETIQNVVTKKAISIIPTTSFVFPVSEILNASAITYRDKHNVRCGTPPVDKELNNQVALSSTINPFKFGVIGDLILDSRLAWQSERINNSHPHGIRFDGAYSDYTPYYSLDAVTKKWTVLASLQKWRRMGENRLTNEYGVPQEGVDQLNIPFAMMLGYSNKLELMPVATAVNAYKQDIGFDGFEDYGYYQLGGPVVDVANYHFSFLSALNANVIQSTEQKHSGLYSLRINGGANAVLSKKISPSCNAQPNGLVNDVFVVNSCVCIPPFKPTPGKEYIVGGWLKKGTSSGQIVVNITGGGTPIMVTILPTAKEIDGWIRMESVPFNIPSGYSDISISLSNTGSSAIYFDDIRVHPFLASMTTVVYDPVTLLPLATHDGYNYTTFYNYDENLELVRVKVETEEGIKTITETEQGGKLKFND